MSADQGAVSRLCQEVRYVTKNRAQLSLRKEKERETRLPGDFHQVAMTLPVQFGQTVYGALHIAVDPFNTDQPALPLVVAQLLAQSCSWMLYTLEQSTFLHSQCQHIDYQVYEPLTKRETEVLKLMFRGLGQEEIAEKLCIAPATVNKHRQHIYERLGVHNERDALLAAYHIGILSLFDDLMSKDEKKDL
ncbi:response regulator transcription factor [Dictyobacter vulcani]|uniref:response regulator transcription factor n=1 Tax=Dictyobacter vulcani TaxID=2607529 RepID=UPI0012509118|nr:helix-turn-helix transcriptional regulator [Dictyobacter vulcani]